jgi:predicted transcriptional regulator of viral defense system
MSPNGYGISGSGRAELSLVVGHRGFITPEQAASELGVNAHVAARKLAHWAERGWLRRVRRGLYIPVPVEAIRTENWSQDAMVVASAVWSPCYFSGWTAANHWGLTEQVFRTTIVKTAQRVRSSKAHLMDAEYVLMHVSEDEIDWGVEQVWHEETRLQIADPARTVVDILDMPRIGGGIRHAAEILGAYLDDHEGERLVDYAQRLGNRAVFKRLGYLLEMLGRDEPGLLSACKAQLSSGVALLDPDGPREGPRVPAWHLRANVHVAHEGPS